jgi:hypothetical protein
MEDLKVDKKEVTGLVVIDPYNDSISDGAKIWPRVKDVAKANNCVPQMLEILNAARKAEIRPGNNSPSCTWKSELLCASVRS